MHFNEFLNFPSFQNDTLEKSGISFMWQSIFCQIRAGGRMGRGSEYSVKSGQASPEVQNRGLLKNSLNLLTTAL